MPSPTELLAEAQRRFAVKASARARYGDLRQRIHARCFPQQLAYIQSPKRKKAAFCTRRAGKTDANAAYLLDGALGGDDRIILFVAKTRLRAIDLTWKPVQKLEEQLGLVEGEDVKPNETKARRTYANGSEIRWTGADDLDELKKKRGDKLFLVIIDEAQDFDFVILRELVEAIFGPSLEDLQGTICLTGTPGEVCAGIWYGLTVTEEDEPDATKRIGGWDVFRWSVLDNPFMAHMKKRLPELIAEKGNGNYDEGLKDPTILREWFGRWVRDVGDLFYAFDPKKNLYDPEKVQPWGPGWYHARGWDLGLRDAMALVYWGFRLDGDRNLYEAYSWKRSGAHSDEVAKHADGVERELGLNVIVTAADTGGLGALVVEEVEARTGMHNDPAKKTDKAGAVKIFNEDLRSGVMKLRPGSPLAQEMAVLPKLKDWDEERRGKPAPEDPRFPNHCCDGGLYAHRGAKHYLSEAAPARPKPGTPEFYADEERRMREQLEEEAHAENEFNRSWGF
jgi:hypothetical protein